MSVLCPPYVFGHQILIWKATYKIKPDLKTTLTGQACGLDLKPKNILSKPLSKAQNEVIFRGIVSTLSMCVGGGEND